MKTAGISKMILISFCVVLMAAGFTGCGSEKVSEGNSSASGMKVIVGTTGQGANWAQTAEKNGTQGLEGFAIDLWNEIGKRNGWTIEFRQGEFAGLWGMLDNDQIDSIAGNISETPPRMEKYIFSEPFYLDNSVFIYKPVLGTAEDIQFFKNKKVSVGAPTSSKLVMDELDEKYGLQIQAINLDTQADVVPNVLSGISEAGLLDKSVANIAIFSLKADLKIFDPHYRVMGSACPFKKTERGKKLEEGVNQAIASMKKDGTLKSLSEKWLHDDLSGMDAGFWNHWVQSK